MYQKVTLKNHLEPVTPFVLPKRFICKVIIASRDDNGHLGMERTLGLLQDRFFWPKMAEDVCIHIHTCDRCLRYKQPQEKAEMQPILVSYPMELIHLDFLTLGVKAGDTKNVNILIVTDHFTKICMRWPVFVYCVLGTIRKSYACMIQKRSYCIALFSIVMVCALYFNSHILLCLCITLLVILYIISIKCV